MSDNPVQREQQARTRLSLKLKVAALLGIALFPLGLISVLQTNNAVQEARNLSGAALLSQTERAAVEEREIIYRAFGAAEALGASVLPSLENADTCSSLMEVFVEASPSYIFAGFIELSGIMNCASSGRGSDFSEYPAFIMQQENPRPMVEMRAAGSVTGVPVIIASYPVYDFENLRGFVSISLPHQAISEDTIRSVSKERGFSLVLFGREGTIIATEAGGADIEMLLPRDRELESLVGESEFSFEARARNGEERIFALVPIIDGDVYALSSWTPGETFASDGFRVFVPVIFPLIMCAVSLIVAYISVNQLVIRPINTLRRQMALFAIGQRGKGDFQLDQAPDEMRDLAAAFSRLAKTVEADEIEREQALEDKSVLLREVYHRVKNNLQLIVSIMNMQIRNAETPREKLLLQQLQDRVMSLSIVHKNLYTASSLASVRADELLGEIVNQLIGIGAQRPEGFRVVTEFDPVTLYPDQAVPLSLLVTEAGTNALKHTGKQDGNTWVKFSLHRDHQGMVDVEVANSKGKKAEEADGSGLGTRLIDAFVNQLGGELEIEETDDLYTLRIRFSLQTKTSGLHDGTE